MLIEKTQIEDESKNLNLELEEFKVWIFLKEILFLNQSNVLLNHYRILFHKFNHDFRLQRSITPNTSIII